MSAASAPFPGINWSQNRSLSTRSPSSQRLKARQRKHRRREYETGQEDGLGLEYRRAMGMEESQEQLREGGSVSRVPKRFGRSNAYKRLKQRELDSMMAEESLDASALLRMADMRNPHRWYPAARAMTRKIILHVGPTNSGKTYRALERLGEAASGVYLAPLRLLAWEVSERLNDGGVPCSLLTGQEKEEKDDARHIACTVEMSSSTRAVDVAVIDEVQMIGDPDRGWAWTRALLATPAPEVHLCGDASAVSLVQELAAITGDTVEINEYARLAPLRVASSCLPGLGHISKGDCVVAFSRSMLYSLKESIEASTGLRCGVVYGSLPPAVRRQQATQFNDPDGPLDVLVGECSSLSVCCFVVTSQSQCVLTQSRDSRMLCCCGMLSSAATDAVGMGLNLAIKRVVFSATEKFDGQRRRPLTISEIKQIGGRAGRYGGDHAGDGLVTCMPGGDLRRISAALGGTVKTVQCAGLLPSTEQLEVFAAALLPAEQRHEALLRVRHRHLASVARGRETADRALDGGTALSAMFDDEDKDQDSDSDSDSDSESDSDSNSESESCTFGMEAAATSDEEQKLADELRAEILAMDKQEAASALHTASGAASRQGEWGDMFSFDEEAAAAGASGARPNATQSLHQRLEEQARDAAAESDELNTEEDMGESTQTDSDWEDSDSEHDWSSAPSVPGVSASPEAAAASATGIMDEWIAAASGARHDASRSGVEDDVVEMPFSRLLQLFTRHSTVDKARFFVCDQADVIDLARAIDDIGPIVLRDRHALCCAPLDGNSALAKHAFQRWARALSQGRTAKVGLRVPLHTPITPAELRAVEDAHKVFDAYLWLARRMPSRFGGVEDCEARLEATETMIADGLERMGLQGAAAARRKAFEEQRQSREAAARDAAIRRAAARAGGDDGELHADGHAGRVPGLYGRATHTQAMARAVAAGSVPDAKREGIRGVASTSDAIAAEMAGIAKMLRAELEQMKSHNQYLLAGATRQSGPSSSRQKHRQTASRSKAGRRLEACGALVGPAEAGQLRTESKMLRRLTRRLARGKSLSRKERRAAQLLLDASLTDKLVRVALANTEEEYGQPAPDLIGAGGSMELSLRDSAAQSRSSGPGARFVEGDAVWDRSIEGSPPVPLAKGVVQDLAAAMLSAPDESHISSSAAARGSRLDPSRV
jgi:ATP-dependent RNA helicase SUPV3L1/SUV3